MEKDNKKTIGSLSISDEVFATIAIKAVSGVAGVAGLLGDSAQEKKSLFTMPSQKAVRITRTDDDVTLEIYILIKYGSNAREVCEAIQQAVKDDIQTMTGNTVSKVNVHVEDIIFDESDGTQLPAESDDQN